jgi:hypothetical protein
MRRISLYGIIGVILMNLQNEDSVELQIMLNHLDSMIEALKQKPILNEDEKKKLTFYEEQRATIIGLDK